MKSIHGVGELMTQVVLRGGGLLPTTPTHQPQGDVVKTQTEPEREDIMVMDTKLKIIEILQVGHEDTLLQTVCFDAWNLTLTFFFQFILNVRLDYRISCLLCIFKHEFDESNPQVDGAATQNGTNNVAGQMPGMIGTMDRFDSRQSFITAGKMQISQSWFTVIFYYNKKLF